MTDKEFPKEEKIDEAINEQEKANAEKAAAPTESEDMISKANASAARIEDANKETQKLLTEMQTLAVEKTLGGKAEAGTEKKEDTPEEYMKKVMANEIEGTDPDAKA